MRGALPWGTARPSAIRRAFASEQNAEGVLGFSRQMEKDTLPPDLAAFNAYHHGGKVDGQDHAILREALGRGEAEGSEMPPFAR